MLARHRRRSRLSAISANPLVLSEDESESSRGLGARESRGARGRALGRTSFERRGCSAISEVTFFTHLTFSAYLPDFQEMEAVRQFVGPLHILQVIILCSLICDSIAILNSDGEVCFFSPRMSSLFCQITLGYRKLHGISCTTRQSRIFQIS